MKPAAALDPGATLTKSLLAIPAKSGIRVLQKLRIKVDPGLRWDDGLFSTALGFPTNPVAQSMRAS